MLEEGMVDNAAGYVLPAPDVSECSHEYPVATEVRPVRSNASSDDASEVETLIETALTELPRVLAQHQALSFVAMSCHRTTHARARHMALLLRNWHSLLRARGHLWVSAATGARVPLTLVLRLLLLAVEWRCKRRSLLAVLLLHVRCVALVGARGLHHVRTRTWRSSVSVGSCALLRHVWHLGLGMRRHGRVALILRWHESIRGRVLGHHWRTSSHLRHVRTEAGARWVARTHLVHCRCLLAYLIFR
jgi:hypothetical protein